MNFTISFEDLINAIKKAIEEHPGITVAAATSMVVGAYFAASPVAAAAAGLGVGGYLVYRATQPKIELTGSHPNTPIPPSHYEQIAPLPAIPKDDNYRNNDSEDEHREAVTSGAHNIPASTETNLYNCWSWAINPINHLLTLSNPVPNLTYPYDINKMKNATRDYLNSMHLEYLCTQEQPIVREFIREAGNENESKLIIGLRVIGDCDYLQDGCDYHYIRWYRGQWSAKCGTSGIVVKDLGPHGDVLEPETMWAGTLTDQEKGRVRLPRSNKGAGNVLRNSIYQGPTTYYLITI